MKALVIRSLFNMAKALCARGLYVIALGNETQTNALGAVNDRLTMIPRDFRDPKSVLDDLQDGAALWKVIRSEAPDVIHINALQDLLSTFIVVHFFFLFKARPVIIAMSHDPFSWRNPKKAWLLAKLIQYLSDGFVCLATTHRNQLISLGVSPEKLAVIPNPYDIDQINVGAANHQPPFQTDETVRITYVAAICERKAQDVLVKAAKLVVLKYPHVHFEMIGRVVTGEEDYAKMISHQIERLGLQDNVTIAGALSYQEVISRVSCSDIFVFPTRAEMMPRAVIEAMVAGRPVVASGVDGILDLIKHRKTGLLVKPGESIELADAVCELIKNPFWARELGLAGQEYILDHCSPERVGNLFHNFYQSKLNS
jgi:glycosyltransferase involved in cell wall biosynthesis